MGNKQSSNKYTIDELNYKILGAILCTVQNKDIKQSNDYEYYDGTGLPPPAGLSQEHACVTYLTNKKEDIPNMEKKRIAIMKYIENTILKDKKTTEDFMKRVTDTLIKGISKYDHVLDIQEQDNIQESIDDKTYDA